MTPMLILLFGVKPSTAISSDLVAAVVMRPFGAAVHIRQETVNSGGGLDGLGSVPMAFLGAYLLHLIGQRQAAQANIEKHSGPPCSSVRVRWYFATSSTAAVARAQGVVARP